VLKSSLTVVSVAILVFLFNPLAHSQQSSAAEQLRVTEREAEWNHWALPQSPFARQTDAAKVVLFQVPAEWKALQPDKLVFSAPHGATLSLYVEKIAEGMPLRDYVSALMQQLRSVTENSDSLVVRRTSMSALEAREVMFETDVDSAEVSRRIIWTTVNGPNAVSVLLITPAANVAEIEPYFKAVVQSVTLIDKLDYVGFDILRSSVIKDNGPTRVDEVQTLAASLTTLGGANRQASINRLAAIFASSPGTAIDLVLDARPMVRAAVLEAISQSRNNSLEKFLLRALDDRELLIAEPAARSIAANPNVINLLRDHSFDWFKVEALARVWPFLSRSNQIRILEEIFATAVVPASTPRRPKVEPSPGKPGVTVRATVLPPGAPPPPVALASDPSRHLHALTLVRDLPPSDFKIPLDKILGWNNHELTTLALQISWHRDEVLPAATLLKLLSSSNSEVRRLAALHLGQSGSLADIRAIEDFAKSSAVASGAVDSDHGLSFSNDLQIAISRIRLREQLKTASGETRAQLIKQGLSDPKLAEWVWYRYVREEERRTTELKSPPRPVKVLPLGENLFPQDVAYYAALPKPASAIDKLSGALDGLQLDSARSQANLVLILSAWRAQFAQLFDSPIGASPTAYSGINAQEPIALASWYVAGAPPGIASAERKAIIVRVADRARFERSLTVYQRTIGNFKSLTDYFSGGIRFLTVLPAVLPLSAKALLDSSLDTSKESPMLKYNLVGETEWNGHAIKVVEYRTVGSDGHMTADSVYLTYLDDTAVLAPDLVSLRDVLTRLSSKEPTLATNSNFKRVVGNPGENPGEAIYLSNLSQVLAPTTAGKNPGKDAVLESGALKISNATWENLYQIKFTESDWLKPFIGFQPEELTSPRELLPRTTVAYYFMNFDPVAGWHDWSKELLSAEQRKDLGSFWAINFEKEVLPELGPECGIAVLGLPNILGNNWNLTWTAFCKLKSDKLARALQSGKLLSAGTSGSGPSAPTHIKLASGDLFVTVKGNFLVLSNNQLGITALDHKEKLSSSRDFSRAAKQTPAGVVAFGGYSLEAAISAIADSGSDSIKSQQLSVITSLANAFHSPSFYATATTDAVQGHFSLSMDREGRFSVSELSALSKEYRLTFAQVEVRGVPIQNQERLSSLKLRILATAAGEIDRIREDVSSTHQIAEKISDKELELTVLPRHSDPKTKLTLPIKSAEFAPYLQSNKEIRSDDKAVIDKAREIAGEERDAWKVAGKLSDWTFKNIKWKLVDYATAPQTLATLEADCLEFSQLYVAMARSLGLPARMVSGLAYAGASFGGHAWVEVYVGEWIELDPTWGTNFVDATHIRNSATGALLTYAALNLIDVEVLAAPRGVAEFQKSPNSLAQKLSEELPKGSLMALTSALDLAVLTDEQLGSGTWESLNNSERNTMTSAYRRLIMEIHSGFQKESKQQQDLRLLKIRESGDRAEAVMLAPGGDESLQKFSFVRRNGGWFLADILHTDTDLHIISETLQPAFKNIMDRRSNKLARGHGNSEFVRVLVVMQKDPAASIAIADRALKEDPQNRGLRHLKALALLQSEKSDEAIKLWKELAGEGKPFAPAFLNLARQHYDFEDKEKQKLAIEFYIRYGELEPEDPRTHIALASLYQGSGDDVKAEVEHRAALKSDPSNTEQFVDYATFLAMRKRFNEAATVVEEADKKAGAEADVFGDLMLQLYFEDDKTVIEQLAQSQPQRMEKSSVANLYLAYVRIENGKSLQALPLLKKAAALKKDSSEPYAAMASAYRKLRNWPAALNAADTAIRIDPEDSDAHFHKACALARLGRLTEALRSLERAVELESDLAEMIGEETDLKVLASKPAFTKLMAGQEEKQ